MKQLEKNNKRIKSEFTIIATQVDDESKEQFYVYLNVDGVTGLVGVKDRRIQEIQIEILHDPLGDLSQMRSRLFLKPPPSMNRFELGEDRGLCDFDYTDKTYHDCVHDIKTFLLENCIEFDIDDEKKIDIYNLRTEGKGDDDIDAETKTYIYNLPIQGKRMLILLKI